jgi:hypothetical protein
MTSLNSEILILPPAMYSTLSLLAISSYLQISIKTISINTMFQMPEKGNTYRKMHKYKKNSHRQVLVFGEDSIVQLDVISIKIVQLTKINNGRKVFKFPN